ncbi:hypothetical protein L5I01_12295 [Gordonia sp. HY442]|uniref:DUF7373 family lipoprotein n=1 Tax=Gordonia zhenghanii TaxID=2911516 RepID=UPI001F318412|nr:hypothetical protein [Gordonia zhenghanii]MCF8604137.1 hypothetical protein [Gordonia zhenghanii]
MAIGIPLVAGLAACTVDGAPVRTPIELDTGAYSMTQTDDDASSPKHRAAVALGEYIPLRTELDPRIGHATVGSGPLSSIDNLSSLYDVDVKSIPENAAFEFGFTASGNNYVPDTGMDLDERESLRTGVLRYTDPAAARAVMDPTIDAIATRWKKMDDRNRADVQTKPLTGGPDGAVMVRQNNYYPDGVDVRAMAVTGRDVLYAEVYGYSPDTAEATVRRSLIAQKKASDASRDIAVVDEYENRDFFTLTVPYLKADNRYMFEGSVAGPRAFATKFHDDKKSLIAFTDAGVDLISERSTVLYRAGTPDKASGLREFFLTSWADGGAQTMASPLDLSSAKCVRGEGDTGSDGPWFSCAVALDRYIATAEGDTLKQAQQKIAAQYTLLTTFG